MKITTSELQDKMQTFYHQNHRLPNTLLLPATEMTEAMSPIKIESLFCMKIIYAAIQEARVCIL